MSLRTLAVACAGVAALAAPATCDGEACAAVDSGDAASLLQAAPQTSISAAQGRASPWMPQEGGLFDDPAFEFVGVAQDWEIPLGYDGPMDVFGEVWITAAKGLSPLGDSQGLQWKLLGLDGLCKFGGLFGGGSCGIAIFNGNPCTGGGPGIGPLFNPSRATNPWDLVSYTTSQRDEQNRSQFFTNAVTGLGGDDVSGATVVVFDHRPGIAGLGACAPIGKVSGATPPPPVMSTSLLQQKSPFKALQAMHFQIIGASLPDLWGRVLVHEIMGEDKPLIGQYISWDLEGLGTECQGGPIFGTEWSCAVRIVDADSCEDVITDINNNVPLVSNYVPTARESDPWQYLGYTSAPGLKGMFFAQNKGVSVLTGYDSPDVLDKPVVVYDHDGNPAGCAELLLAGEK